MKRLARNLFRGLPVHHVSRDRPASRRQMYPDLMHPASQQFAFHDR